MLQEQEQKQTQKQFAVHAFNPSDLFLGVVHEDHIKNKLKISHSPMNLERKTASCWIICQYVVNGVCA